jgi:uncharacterized membrane protein YccF (DUF307 family)
MTDDYAQRPPPPGPPPAGAPPTPGVIVVAETGPGAGSVILNILWVVFSGVWLFISYVVAGIVQCLTIIGIPFGVQSFKLAAFALWPFGRVVVTRSERSEALSCVGNVLWFVLAGFWLALEHAILGLLLCITIIGIPLGLGNFKLIPLALAPFGRDIVPKDQVVVAGAWDQG